MTHADTQTNRVCGFAMFSSFGLYLGIAKGTNGFTAGSGERQI